MLTTCGADAQPGSTAACASGFRAAASACPDPPDAGCCAAVSLLGKACLARLAGDPSLSGAV